MITIEIARALRKAGLEWHPASGDAFRIERPDLDSDVFHVSEMTIEPHQFDTGTILGFNGTTEWALDSLALEDALWLPREDQLRGLLGDAFQVLQRVPDAGYRVDLEAEGLMTDFDASSVADAYGRALLWLLRLRAGTVAEGSA
ncbi:hypothetical protein E3T55_12260 [Cryobacterium frigoriphilum]|uniref:Pilus assembly protein CpaE n=1 Tax=Cryobacterium frigoriphilum TaxID=1259150 RepID=A0A4R8ZY71_9MICO|nr:hypothetical protein [Cryobacterium frigoriphilum]TFD48826.1 hypothetical protein E3T55_12260 [Cryobacterium frigoriphilum]